MLSHSELNAHGGSLLKHKYIIVKNEFLYGENELDFFTSKSHR